MTGPNRVELGRAVIRGVLLLAPALLFLFGPNPWLALPVAAPALFVMALDFADVRKAAAPPPCLPAAEVERLAKLIGVAPEVIDPEYRPGPVVMSRAELDAHRDAMAALKAAGWPAPDAAWAIREWAASNSRQLREMGFRTSVTDDSHEGRDVPQ